MLKSVNLIEPNYYFDKLNFKRHCLRISGRVEHGGHQIWQQITGLNDSSLNKNHAKYQPPSLNGF